MHVVTIQINDSYSQLRELQLGRADRASLQQTTTSPESVRECDISSTIKRYFTAIIFLNVLILRVSISILKTRRTAYRYRVSIPCREYRYHTIPYHIDTSIDTIPYHTISIPCDIDQETATIDILLRSIERGIETCCIDTEPGVGSEPYPISIMYLTSTSTAINIDFARSISISILKEIQVRDLESAKHGS